MNSAIRSRSATAIVVIWLAAAINAAALPNVQAVARAIDSHYNRLQSLQADFTEIYQGGGIERTESGTMWLKKPGKMRWEYRSPEEKLFVGDGRDAWLYLPAEKQARKSSMRRLEDLRSPLAFLLGKSKLEKELEGLSFAPDVKAWQPGNSILRGVPRGMEDRVRQVMLEVTPEHRIVRILVHGSDDSITEYRLNNQRENTEVPDSRFRFTAPPGAEIVEDESGQ